MPITTTDPNIFHRANLPLGLSLTISHICSLGFDPRYFPVLKEQAACWFCVIGGFASDASVGSSRVRLTRGSFLRTVFSACTNSFMILLAAPPPLHLGPSVRPRRPHPLPLPSSHVTTFSLARSSGRARPASARQPLPLTELRQRRRRPRSFWRAGPHPRSYFWPQNSDGHRLADLLLHECVGCGLRS